ncbi:MAG: DUF763 domain-containing protein [Promethearchaeota archaeon]|nr:MAG: DUF763 domain-containing protein [Candidatus Lokiarchaeota archaeon]
MNKVGIATLPLHGGKAPAWLFKRMVTLAKPIFKILYDMEGSDGILRRISDTYWFQGLSCILGYDWHSSGVTTVLGGVFKEVLNPLEHGLMVAGGKGKISLKVKEHLQEKAKNLDYNEDEIEKLNEISRLVAKIDNAAIQDGFGLYHHNMFVSENNWAIVQQGMDIEIKKARRYHWFSEELTSFLNNPHSGISSEILKEKVLDMASKDSQNCRKVSLDLVSEGSNRLKRYLSKLKDGTQTSLDDFIKSNKSIELIQIPHLNMPIPFILKWDTLDMAKDLALDDYTELLKLRGLGPGMIRALALISEFIWGEPPSWKDPAKYAFAMGGKDGIPYPVNLKRMEKCAEILEVAINSAKLDQKDKLGALKRLHKFEKKTYS